MSDVVGLQAISWTTLTRSLSEPRLDAYRDHPGESSRTVFGRYIWNIELCRSLYHPLHFLEVALRNSLHRAATARCRTDTWYDHTPSILTRREQEAIMKAKQTLAEEGKPLAPGRVIASLSFGFWVSLLSTDYEQKLWPWHLANAFPNMPRSSRTRQRISERLHYIRKIRNAAFHFGKICKRSDLPDIRHKIQETTGWVDIEVSRLPTFGEGFEDVCTRGPNYYEINII